MDTTKHTPGPWAVNPGIAQVDAFDKLGDGSAPLPVCQLLWPTDQRSEAETEANARLIASAPELLEALKEAEAMFRWYGDLHQFKEPPATEKAIRNYDMAEKLAAVVAKAEGKANG